MPCIEEQDRGADNLWLAQPSAAGSRRHQLGQQVIAWVGAAGGDFRADECREIPRRDICRALLGDATAELVHRHHRVRPGQELGRHLPSNPKESRDHTNRDGGGVGLQQINTVPTKIVDQSIGQYRDVRPQPLDLPGDERASDQPA